MILMVDKQHASCDDDSIMLNVGRAWWDPTIINLLPLLLSLWYYRYWFSYNQVVYFVSWAVAQKCTIRVHPICRSPPAKEGYILKTQLEAHGSLPCGWPRNNRTCLATFVVHPLQATLAGFHPSLTMLWSLSLQKVFSWPNYRTSYFFTYEAAMWQQDS